MIHNDLQIMAKFIANTFLSKQAGAITGKEIASIFNAKLDDFNARFNTHIKKISETHIRDMINWARSNDVCKKGEICACPSGYYLSEEKEEILKQIESLEGRISSINNAIKGMRKRVGNYKSSSGIKPAKIEYNNKPPEGDLFDSL